VRVVDGFSEVEERSGEGGDRDSVVFVAVLRVDLTPVETDAGSAPNSLPS
jgi:hypothetical protein